MSDKSWKRLFPAHILERGEYYFISGAVKSAVVCDDEVKAVVHGSEDYDVIISYDGNTISDMYCDCPYAEDGSACKHMAAVLYSLEREAPQIAKSRPIINKTPISEVLNRLSEVQLRNFLIELATDDPHIDSIIRRQFAGCSPETCDALQSEIFDIIHNAQDKDGYIDYYDAYDCMCSLCDYLQDNVPPLIVQGAYENAFDLVCIAYTEATQADMDDSDGGLSILSDMCSDYWKDIIQCANPDQLKNMYRWFEEHVNGCYVDYTREYIEDIMVLSFEDPELMEKSLSFSKSKLSCVEPYLVERYAKYCLILMQRLDYPEATIEAFRAKYRYLPFIREDEIEQALSEGQYEKAVELLKESIELDSDKFGLVRQYECKIIDIYESIGQSALLEDALKHYIYTLYQNDLTYVLKYKGCLSPEAWETALKELISLPSCRYIKCRLLLEEKKYRELFDEVKRVAYLPSFLTYESVLRENFPAEALSYYTQLLSNDMNTASSRTHYYSIMSHFEGLLRYPGGREQILYLANKWRCSFPRRRAMLDELSKALKRCHLELP